MLVSAKGMTTVCPENRDVFGFGLDAVEQKGLSGSLPSRTPASIPNVLSHLQDLLRPHGAVPPTFENLSHFSSRAFLHARNVAEEILSSHTPEVLNALGGPELIVWLRLNAFSRVKLDPYLHQIGADPLLLVETGNLLRTISPIAQTFDCFSQNYTLFTEGRNFPFERSFTEECLLKHRGKNHLLDLERYSVKLFNQTDFDSESYTKLSSNSGNIVSIIPATPFILTLDLVGDHGHPFSQYALAFYASSGKTLLINQLQAPNIYKVGEFADEQKTRPTGLGPFDHKQVLVEHASLLARSFGFERIGIQSAKNNRWLTENFTCYEHLPLDRAIKIYDQTAEKAGFKLSTADGNWYREI